MMETAGEGDSGASKQQHQGQQDKRDSRTSGTAASIFPLSVCKERNGQRARRWHPHGLESTAHGLAAAYCQWLTRSKSSHLPPVLSEPWPPLCALRLPWLPTYMERVKSWCTVRLDRRLVSGNCLSFCLHVPGPLRWPALPGS